MKIDNKTLRNLFLGAGACILLYWILHETEHVKGIFSIVSGIFAPFVVGAALAFIFNVPMRAVERYIHIEKAGVRRALAIVLTFVAMILVVILIFNLLIPQLRTTVMTLIEQLSAFFTRMINMAVQYLESNPELQQWFYDNTDIEKLNWQNIDWEALIENVLTVAGNSVSTIGNGAFSVIGDVSAFAVNAVVSIVFSLYCLARKEVLARQGRRLLYSFLPEHVCDETIRIFRLTNTTFSNFISGQCLEAVILGCLFALSMALLKMPYVALISVIIAVTALVPLVGAFVGCFLGAFFILVDNPMQAVWFVVMFLVLQQIEGNLIYPKVVGTSIGLPGMWVLVAVTVGGELMGIGGMFLMIPITSVLYTLMREVTNKRLAQRGIDPHKLEDQPPELKSKFKVNREKREKRRQAREQNSAEKFDNDSQESS